ncbi:MAG: hypothetical protein K2P41_05465 [Lachnospiraceae bacterium]|nr:hypothetical protein [Lachnospiraceae bacterium]
MKVCDRLGIPGMKKFIDYILVFDGGTSLWHDRLTFKTAAADRKFFGLLPQYFS